MTFLYGVSQFLFSALALAVVLALVRLLRRRDDRGAAVLRAIHQSRVASRHALLGRARRSRAQEQAQSLAHWRALQRLVQRSIRILPAHLRSAGRGALRRPWLTVAACAGLPSSRAWLCFPSSACRSFPRTDAGMFVINVKAPSGSRISVTEAEVAKVEALIRQIVPPERSGRDSVEYRRDARISPRSTRAIPPSTPRSSRWASKTTTRSAATSTWRRVKRRIAEEMPELSTYFQSGGMVDAVLNLGLPAPIDVQVAGSNLERSHETALKLASRNPADSRRGGRLHPAGHRLSGAEAGRGSHARERTGTRSAGGGRQRHHGAHQQSDDRAQLTGSIRSRARTTC